MDAITTAQFTAVGIADFLVNYFFPKWDFFMSLLSDNSRQFSSQLVRPVCETIGMRKLTSSAHHRMGNSATEYVNQTMAQWLLYLVANER